MTKLLCLFDPDLIYSFSLVARFRAGLSGENVGTISRRFADVEDDWTSSCPALYRVSTPSFPAPKDVDGRDKPGQDEKRGCNSSFAVTACFPRTTLRFRGNDGLSRAAVVWRGAAGFSRLAAVVGTEPGQRSAAGSR
jgi:hypothetical protein